MGCLAAAHEMRPLQSVRYPCASHAYVYISPVKFAETTSRVRLGPLNCPTLHYVASMISMKYITKISRLLLVPTPTNYINENNGPPAYGWHLKDYKDITDTLWVGFCTKQEMVTDHIECFYNLKGSSLTDTNTVYDNNTAGVVARWCANSFHRHST